jgi:hypothetical protein
MVVYWPGVGSLVLGGVDLRAPPTKIGLYQGLIDSWGSISP